MAICVNTNSKEFKDLFNSMDISKGTLELVLHQMLNSGELEGRPYPTKEEILERLYPSTFEGSNNLVKLWDIKYSEDRVFGSLNRAIEYSREAIKLFGENNVRVIELKEGAKVVVAHPSRESYVKYILDKESNVTIPGKSKPSSNRELLKEDYSRSREFEDKVVRTLASRLVGINVNNLGKEFSTTIKATKDSERVQSYIDNLKRAYGDTITIKATEYSNGTTTISYKFKTFNSLYNEATKSLYSNIDTYLESLTPDKIYEEIGRIEDSIENSDKEDNLYYINPNKKEEIVNQILKKVVYTKQVIDSSIAWLETLPNTPEDNLFVKDVINFIKRGSMTNFEMYGSVIREAWDFARSKGADMQKFKTAEDLILWSLEQKAQNINETTSRTYSKEEINKKFDKFQFSYTVASESGEPIYIYDVEDSAEGRQQVTQILADTTPKDSTGKPIIGSPWCLSTYNYNKETGIATPTSSSEFYWESYGGGKRQIAIYKGKPIAFNSSKENKEAWWDFNDTKSEENILDTDITANTTIIEGKKKSLSKHSEEFMSIVGADRKSMVTAGILNSIDSQGNQKGGISKTIMLDPKDPTIVNTESYSNIDNELKSNREIELYIETKKNAKPRATISIVTDLGNYNTKAKNLDNAAYNGYENGILIHIKDSNNNRFIIDVARDTLSSNTFDITVSKSIIGTTPGTYFTIKINSDNGKLRLVTRDNSGKLIDLELPSSIIDKIKSIIGEENLYKYIEESEKHTSRESKIKNDIEWADKSVAILNNIEKIAYAVLELVPDSKIKRTMDTLYNLDHPTKESTVEETTYTKDTTTKTTKKTTETPKVYSTEEAVERRANVQEAYSQSENTERMQTLRRGYQKEYEVVSEFSEGTVTTEDVDNVVTQMETGILANMYNEQVRKPINQELNRKLKEILKKFHFEIIEDALMETFGDDILGATDLVQKIVYLASEGKQNAITMPEEFAHSFIALMGNSYRNPRNRANFPSTKLYSELMDLVGETSIFRQVYTLYKDAYTDSKGNPNMMALREEALGQALAAVILNRDKNISDKDRTFFTKLKEWFNSIINSIRELFGHKDPLSAERQLYKELDSIADSILDGSYFEKYLKKLNPKGYNRVGVADSIRYDIEHNNGKMVDFMRFVNSLGGIIDGSFAYRAQGDVFRPGLDTLHDIDCVIPLNVHGLQTKYPSIARNSQFRRGYWDSAHLEAKIKETDFYKSIKDKYGDSFHFLATYTTGEDVIVNGVICEDNALVERFISMSGNFNDRLKKFTEEERNRFYLVDFFMVNRNENRIYQAEGTDITMSDYVVPFTAKMKMGRAKDIFDYQNFNPNHRTLYRNTGSERTVFYQKDPTKSTTFSPETAEFYSGAADGADTVWGTKTRELGIKVKDYTVKDWDKLPSEWKEKLDKIYKEVVSRLGRRELSIDTYRGKLVRRDMMQAEKADAIFAVSSIGSNGLVDGGTGYATTRGIIRGIPVYVFDQVEEVWKVWDGDKFIKTTQPILTNNAAVIGTRKINEAGVKAIESILKSTMESIKTPTTTEKVQWGVTSENSFEVSTAANNSNVIGDSRFSALNAKFKPGTIIDGVDVGGKTIEYVYQNIIKKSGKGKAPSKDSKLYRPNTNSAPFTLEDFKVRVPDHRDVSGGTIGITDDGEYIIFHTIEGAFQAEKLNYLDDISYTEDEIKKLIEEGKDSSTILKKLSKAKTEQEAINIANEVQLDRGLNTEAWDAAAPIIRKALEDKYGQSLSKEELEDFSYYEGYLPLWQEWAKQNPELIEELREKSKGRVLTDRFANKTKVSQARALADILNSTSSTIENTDTQTTSTETIKPTVVDGKPMKFNMNFAYGNEKTERITADTTLEAIKRGERTATTRYVKHGNIDRWKRAKVGDILEFTDKQENSVLVRVTKPMTQLSQDTSAEEWSAKEGWNTDRFYSRVKPEIDKGEAYQIEFEVVSDSNTSTVTTTEETTPPVVTSTEVIEPTTQKDNKPRKEEPSVLDKLIKEAEDEQKSRKVATANEKYLEQQLKVTRQLDELYASNISTTEVGEIARQAVFWISDFITDLQEKKDHAVKIFGDKFKDMDFSKMSRVEIIKAIGIDTIVDMCRLKLTTKNENITTLGERRKAGIVAKNWGAIMLRAKVIFPDVEKFSIVSSDNGSFDIEENVSIDLDSSTIEDYNNTTEQTDIAELEGNIQEAWTIEQRTQDILTTMSDEVRRALQKCYILDEKGNILKSKWGINERVTVRAATNSILRWTQGAYTLERMIAMLKTKVTTNPWIQQIIERLESTDTDKTLADGTKVEASESDFKSQFFGTMYKPFQLYSVVSEVITNEDGTTTTQYKSRIVNRNPALRDAINQVTIQYKLGNHPMFTSSGVNKTALKDLKNVYDQLGGKLNDNFDNIDTINSIATGLTIAASLLGYYSTPEILVPYLDKATFSKMHSTLDYIIKALEDNVNNPNYEPFKFGTKDSIENNVKNFIKPFTESLEDIAVTAFFDSGKMYQSYVQPSYLTKLIQKLKTEDPEVLKEFLDREFGSTEWFYTKETGWRNTWLKMIADEGGKILEHKVQLNFNKHNYMKDMSDMEYTLSLIAEYFAEPSRRQDTLVPAWFRVPMQSNKPSSEFIKFYSFRGEFYKDSIVNGLLKIFNQEISRIQTVILRNRDKKDASYITNFDKNGKRFCFLDFLNTYLDGDKKNSGLGELLKKKIDGTITQAEEVKLLKGTEDTKGIEDIIRQSIEERAKKILDEWEAQGIIDEVSKKIPGVGASKEVARANLENFIWNDTLASMNILQLTITDIAFYKNAEDLQKRLAQIHAPGIRGNDKAVDYAGNPVTDSKFRSVKLKDWDGFISNVIENIDIVFNRKIEAVDAERQRCIESAKAILKANGIEVENIDDLNIDNSLIQAKIKDYYNNLTYDAAEELEKVISVLPTLGTKKKTLIALKESLTREAVKDENGNVIVPAGLYRQINVTDAQGYSCPTSYRKKAYIFGKWSRKKEALWKRLIDGTYSTSDLEEAFGEPLKPFVYSRIFKSSGVEKAPIKTLDIPIQYKNSEYLLFMADALLRSEDTGRPNILRALYNVMENSHFNPDRSYRTDGIDTIQFESTTKSGLMGAIDITDLLNNPNGEAIAEEIMRNNLYKREEVEIEEVNPKTGEKEKRTVYNRSTEYNTDTVDVIPFEDYCIQQEIPEHFANHEQAHGSQARYLTISELDSYNYKGEEVKYRVEIDGEVKEVSPKEFIEEYEKNIAANIEEKIIEVMDDLGLNNFTSIKDRNIALSKILQREILSSSRYGIDLLLACSLNEDGTFRIPLGDPIQSRRIEQLINSIIKNRVNKQEVPGGPVVQVSNFGTSRMLNIKFKDKDGGLLMTRDEFNEAKKKGTLKDYATYNDYIKENQRGIAYFEVFAPAYTKELFKEFMNSKGEVDVETIEQISPELLKMVGYRIPTEDKYSMAPLKIVGFLPREAGNAIMMPNDITLINGSDFDIDKMYLMVKKLMIAKRFEVEGNKTMSEAEADYIKHNKPSLIKVLDEAVRANSNLSEEDLSKLTKQKITQFLRIDLHQPRQLDDAVTRELRKAYINYMYYAIEPNRNSRDYRNNKIVDMTFEVLTHETSTDKVLNPGGFDPQKKMGYLVEAYKTGAATPKGRKYTYQELEAMSIEELKDLSIKGKNLCFIDTQVQFYRQNSAAGSLISIFAVNRTAHATLESANTEGKGTKYKVNVTKAASIKRPFIVLGMTFGGLMDFDMRYDIEGNLIGKTLGSLVASSVDAVKDPTLNLMNINSNTSNILTSLVRMGMPFEKAALFLSQRCITNILREYSKENIGKSKALTSIIKERLEKLKKDLKIGKNGNLAYEELKEEQLIKGLIETDAKHEYKVLNAFLRFSGIANALRLPTLATRFNSISSAVGPLVIDNLIMEHKINKLNNESCIIDENKTTVTVQQIVNDHPILSRFKTAYDVANMALSSIPTNSRGFRNVLHTLEGFYIADTIFNDRKLLGQLGDFYQTTLLYRTGVLSKEELPYFINDFPKEFLNTMKDLREKKEYKDNALLNAMRVTTEGEDSRVVLKIDLTGLDITERTKLSDAWIDLHKLNPELSIKLFKYCAYRGGIGFNPKTFMNLLPIYVREKIPGYVSTYEKLSSVDGRTVIEQFVRNNWGNNYLVPRYNIPNGDIVIEDGEYLLKRSSKQAPYISKKSYIKVKINNKDHLFRVRDILGDRNPYILLEEVEPLGNNGHYVEIISEVGENRTIPENDKKALEVPTTAQDTSESILTDRNTGEVKEEIDDTPSYTEQEQIDILYNVFTIEGVRDRDAAKQKVDSEFKSKSDKEKSMLKNSLSKFIESRLKVLNIKYDAKLVEDLVEKLCY